MITSSPVLAKRDSVEMAAVYEHMGLNVGHNCSEDMEKRKPAYAAHIVYGDMARFQSDHLLHTFYKRPLKAERMQAETAVVVDEVDNMLLDNGNNMLYLSHSVPGVDLLDSLLIYIRQLVTAPIYTGEKSDQAEMQQKFDTATIKSKVLDDLFGCFSIDDLTSIGKMIDRKP